MKTRESIIGGCLEGPLTYHRRNFFDASWPNMPPSPIEAGSLYTRDTCISREKMTDDAEGSNRLKWNDVSHYKMEMPNPLLLPGQTVHRMATNWSPWYGPGLSQYYTSEFQTNSKAWNQFWHSDSDLGSPTLYNPETIYAPLWIDNPVQAGEFIPPPLDYDAFMHRAFKSMMPRVKPSLSLLNSIYELKDFRGMARKARSIADRGLAAYRTAKVDGLVSPVRETLRSLAQQFRKSAKSRDAYRTRSGRVSDAYLQWMFAIKPLITDVQQFIVALTNTERQLRRLLLEANRPVTKHFEVVWNEAEDKDNEWNVYDPIANFNWPWVSSINHTSLRNRPSVFHVEVQYNYHYTDLQIAHARLYAALDSIGINLNPAIIWNAIPWTFVIDWFVNVSSLLSGLRVDNMEPTLNIRRCLWSVKRRRAIYAYYQICTDSWARPTYAKVTMPTVSEVAYRRQTVAVKHTWLLAGGLTLEKVSLGVALLLPRRRRRPRWR